ncbi:MAG: FAS1-like dehydratase domain-containing protein [Pikeienuella sp.]
MTHPAIGREMTLTDQIDPWRAAAMHATIDAQGPAPTVALPLFWHWIYFLEARPARELGRDGHPAKGGFIPDLGLPRRMWAGGRLTFHAPLQIGAPASKRTVIEAITEKTGRSGPLAFVTLRHEISGREGLCITEHQDIVYRKDPDPDAPTPSPPVAPTDETASRTVVCGPTTLFRYSALTFNGHRIHYDRDYAQTTEGYAGLVVHGPLIAQMLLAEASERGEVANFTFRAASPAFDFEDIALCFRPKPQGADLWARGPDGRLIMAAAVEYRV